MKTRKWLGTLLLSAIAFGGCADQAVQDNVIIELQESVLNAPQTIEVTKGDIQVVTYYDAQVGPKVEQLTFAEEGTFGELLVQLGDTVCEGDILATPALEDIEEAIENKEKELEALTVTYNHKKASLENELAIAKLELDNVYAKLEIVEPYTQEFTDTCTEAGIFDEQRRKLELQLKQLQETYELELPYQQKQLKKLRAERDGNLIRAPFDGVVVALAEVEYGDHIDTKQYYVAVADPSVDYARCQNISTTVLNKLEKIVLWKDGKEYEATYIPMEDDYRIATKNSGENTYSEFEISDPNGELTSGDYGKIKLLMKEKTDVLLLPEIALQPSGTSYYVYKYVDGEYEKVDVKVGYMNGLKAEIVEGLEEGDVVYVQE